jgi:hypothetical protein
VNDIGHQWTRRVFAAEVKLGQMDPEQDPIQLGSRLLGRLLAALPGLHLITASGGYPTDAVNAILEALCTLAKLHNHDLESEFDAYVRRMEVRRREPPPGERAPTFAELQPEYTKGF